MRSWTPAAALLLAIAGTGSMPAQVTPVPQDLTVTPLFTGVAAAGDFAIDGSGTTWVLTTQGTLNSATGTIARISPAGVVTLNALTLLNEVGQMITGQDGDVYFWMNFAPNVTSLCHLFQNGILSSGTLFPGWIGLGCTQDASGSFYVGLKANSLGGTNQTGIWRLSASGANLIYHAAGLTGSDNRLLCMTGGGRLYAADAARVVEVLGPTSLATVFQALELSLGSSGIGAGTPCPTCAYRIDDLDLGYYDVPVVAATMIFSPGALTTELRALKAQNGGSSRISIANSQSPATVSIARDANLPNPRLALLNAGSISRLEGLPALLAASRPAPAQMRLDVNAPAGGFILALDTINVTRSITGYGTFHTSLGLNPTFWAVLDNFGLFSPASPFAVIPFSSTFGLAQTFGVTVVIEAYVASPLALNGILLISNPVTIAL